MLGCAMLKLGWAGCHDTYMQDVGMTAGSTVRRYRSFWQQQQRGMSMQHNIQRKLRSCCVKLLLIQLSTKRWSRSRCNCFHRSDCKSQCAISQFNIRTCVQWEAVHSESKIVPTCNTKDKSRHGGMHKT